MSVGLWTRNEGRGTRRNKRVPAACCAQGDRRESDRDKEESAVKSTACSVPWANGGVDSMMEVWARRWTEPRGSGEMSLR